MPNFMYGDILFYAHEISYGNFVCGMNEELSVFAVDYKNAKDIPKTLKHVRRECKLFNKTVMVEIRNGTMSSLEPADAFIKMLGGTLIELSPPNDRFKTK